MTYTFIASKAYSALLRSYRLTMDDARAIENAIMEGPKDWPMIVGTGGVRKMRFAGEGSGAGKSGGFRVCYLLLEEAGQVYLFMLYAKNDAQNVTQEQKRQLAGLVRQIKDHYRRSKMP